LRFSREPISIKALIQVIRARIYQLSEHATESSKHFFEETAVVEQQIGQGCQLVD
jgi:hypothetical protein